MQKEIFRAGKTRPGKIREQLTLPSGTKATTINQETYDRAREAAARCLKEREKD